MKRIVVTGGNKGIGLAIVMRLLKEFSDTYIFLGSRNRKRGEIAIEQTIIELGESVKSRVKVLDLDVTSDKSIQNAVISVQKLLRETEESLYGLVNNAGGFEEGMSGQNIIDLNMYGVYRVTEAFLPLIEAKGRIVQVSSGAGPMFLQKCRNDIQALLANKSDVTWNEIEARVIKPAVSISQNAELPEEEKSRQSVEKGLGEMSGIYYYGLAKACVNTYTFILSKQHPNIMMNSCSPGFIQTDLTKPWLERSGKTPEEMGMLPVEKGTVAPIHLLMGNLEGNGRYYGSDGKRSPMHKYRSPNDPEYDGSFP